MLKRVLTSHDHIEVTRTMAGSVLPQEPARRLLCRALEVLGTGELGPRLIENLASDADGCCRAIEQLEALLKEPGQREGATDGQGRTEANKPRPRGE
jgi:hypothetical protein